MSQTLSPRTVSAPILMTLPSNSNHGAQSDVEESKDILPSFPYSHRRSDSTLSLAPTRRPSCRRTNSVVRTGREIIPLVLKAESSPSVHKAAGALDRQSSGHRRGLSINIGTQPRTATSARAVPEPLRKARPSSMFFDRFFTPKDDENASIVSNLTTGSSETTPTMRSIHRTAARPQSIQQTPSAVSCSCKTLYVKSEARLMGKISDLEAERDTKDLTISILSEQLLDKSQEIELLRMKLAGLERALAGEMDTPLCSPSFDAPFKSVLSGADSGIGSSAGCQTIPSPPRSTTESARLHKTLSGSSVVVDSTIQQLEGDVSYDELIDENVALKQEVLRLSNVLEDGLGALATLGI